MKVVYDPEVDVLSVLLRRRAGRGKRIQDKPGVILDYDAGGNMVSFEILDASKRMANPMSRRVRRYDPASPAGMSGISYCPECQLTFQDSHALATDPCLRHTSSSAAKGGRRFWSKSNDCLPNAAWMSPGALA